MAKTKSNLEKLVRSKRKLRIIDLLNMSDANSVLESVSDIPDLEKVIILAQTPEGAQIFHNYYDIQRVIFALGVVQHQLVNDFLYEEESESDG